MQLERALAALLAVGEAGIVLELRPADHLAEGRPQPVVAHHQELQPAIVLGAIEVGQRVLRLVRRLARHQRAADRGAREGRAVGPGAVGIERGADPAALAGLVAMAQAEQDRRHQGHRRGAVALRGQ